MIGPKEMGKISLVLVLVAVAASTAADESEELNGRNNILPLPYPFDRRLQYLLETKRQETHDNLKILGDIINLYIKHVLNNVKETNKRTTCILDGGFSSSCNHQDAVEAGAHHKFLESSFSPGRRKRGLLTN